MTSPGNLGSVEVDVELNISDVGPRLRRALRRPAEQLGRDMEQQLGRAGDEAGQAYTDRLSDSLRRSVDGVSPGDLGADVARDAAEEMGSAGEAAGAAYGSSLSRSLGASLAGVAKTAALAGSAIAAVGVAQLGRSAFTTATNLQRVEAALVGMYGSADKAESMIARIQDTFADSSVGTVDVFARVAQSLAWVGSSGDQAITIMQNLETALTVAGGGAEQLDSVGDALASIANQGKATADEINQISASGLPIWDMLAAKLGTDVPKAMEKVSDGAVKIDTVLGALEDAGGDFFKQMDAASDASSKTFSASWERSKNRVINAFSDLTKGGLDDFGPQVEKMADRIADAMDNLPKTITTVSAALSSSGIAEFFRDTVLPAVQDIAEVAMALGESLLPLLPIIGDVASAMGGTFASALSLAAGLVGPIVDVIVGLNDALGGMPAIVLAAALAIRKFRSSFQNMNLRKAARGAADGVGEEIASQIDRESTRAEGRASKAGSRIGDRLKGGFRRTLGAGAIVGVVSAAFSGMGDAVEAEGDNLGSSIGTALKIGAAMAGPIGIGITIGNEIIKGITGVDLIGTVGGWIGDFANWVGEAWDQITGKTSEVNARLREMGEAIAQVQVPAAETRERLIELVNAANRGDMTAITALRNELDKLPGLSNETREALRGALDAAKSGDFTGLHQLGNTLRDLRAEAEGFGGVIANILGMGEGPPMITDMRGLLGLDELAEGAREAKPPVDELRGSVQGLGEASGQAGQSGAFLNDYLGGLMPSSYNAQHGIQGLSGSLLNFQSSSASAAASAGLMSQMISGSIGSAALTFTTQMNGMSALAIAVWDHILQSTTTSMGSQREAVQQGMQGMTAETRSGFNHMTSAVRAGGGGVISEVRALRSRIVSSMSGLNNSLYSVGFAAAQGLASGIRSGVFAPVNAAIAMASAAAQAARDASRMASPSRVFMEIGEAMSDGMRIGLQRGTVGVAAAGRDLAMSAAGGAAGAVEGLPGVHGHSVTGTSRNYNTHRTVTNNLTVTTAATDPRAVAALVKARLDSATAGVV